MNSSRIYLSLALVALLGLFSCSSEKSQTSSVSADGSVSTEEFQNRLLIHTAGATQVNQVVIGQLLANELERRQSEGDDMSLYEVSEEAVDAQIAKLQTEFAQKNPTLDFWSQIAATGNDEASYREEIKNVLVIDYLMFPADPSKWRLDELGEIFQKGKENSMYDNIVGNSIPAFEEAWAKGERFQMDEMMMQLILRPYFMRWLWDSATVEYPFDGLPEGVALRISGKDISTESLMARLSLAVGPVELDRAERLAGILSKGAERLVASGDLMSVEDVNARIAEEKVEYENSPISYEMVALQFYGYPSMEIYHQVYRLKQSFADTLKGEDGKYSADLVAANTKNRHHFLAGGKVDAEVILLSARSMDNGRYSMEGDPFADAAARAALAAEDLKDNEWAATLMKFSDLPEAVTGAPAGAPSPNRGRFGPQLLNPLREFMGETEYTDLLYGVSVAENLFFTAEVNTIYGPVAGATGSYIYKLNSRGETTKDLNPEENANDKYLIESDYLGTEFRKFVDTLFEG